MGRIGPVPIKTVTKLEYNLYVNVNILCLLLGLWKLLGQTRKEITST